MKFLHDSPQMPSFLALLLKSFTDSWTLPHYLITWFLKTDIGSGNLFCCFHLKIGLWFIFFFLKCNQVVYQIISCLAALNVITSDFTDNTHFFLQLSYSWDKWRLHTHSISLLCCLEVPYTFVWWGGGPTNYFSLLTCFEVELGCANWKDVWTELVI